MAIEWKQENSITRDGEGPEQTEPTETIVPASILLPPVAADISWPDFVQTCQAAWFPGTRAKVAAPALTKGVTAAHMPVWELFNGDTLTNADFTTLWYPTTDGPWFTEGADWWETAAILTAAKRIGTPAAVRTLRTGDPLAQRLISMTVDDQRVAFAPGAEVDPGSTADPNRFALAALGIYTTLAYIWHAAGRPHALTFVTTNGSPALSQAIAWGRVNGYPWHVQLADPRIDPAVVEQWLRHVQVTQNYTLGADAALSLATAEQVEESVVLGNFNPYLTADVALSAVTNREHPHDALAASQILSTIIALPVPRVFRKLRRTEPTPLPALTADLWQAWLTAAQTAQA
ncbi:hypothetical protein [Schleiferilactobacillus shenzhenensis]|uniref:Uncharacterized protein n=1 Tax=Schleiferilactobacillus shenzhenensis LY-73 TaxID=1231336 RepID=U4TTD8_9LACO|nr:hypothetical protein [Schleiferilactobacillus shenzhenensis]ERL66680.1 hypothetical protein L248_0359 [Schleiferilactobacillus shenzhenensis LY-73]